MLVVFYFLLGIISVFFDFAFPNETLDLVIAYEETLETDWSDTKWFFMGGFALLAVIFSFYIFIGLLLFWDSARLIYLIGFFIFMPVYFFTGVIVSSATGQALFDISSVLSGVILALIYYSPVKSYFTEKTTNPMGDP